jgi:hypothetical protein
LNGTGVKGADRADRDEFRNAAQPRLLHQFDAHRQVVVKESSRTRAIGAYAAYHRGQMNHDFRARVGVHPPDGVRAAQVVVARTRHEYLGASRPPQFRDHVAAQESSASRDCHPVSRQTIFRLLSHELSRSHQTRSNSINANRRQFTT